MTKRQTREYKAANQARKIAILESRAWRTGKRDLIRFMGGVIQDGKYTKSR